MAVEAYPNSSLMIADLFILKAGVAVKEQDIMVKTGNIVNGRMEVDVMSGSYHNSNVVGESFNEISAEYPYREITIAVKGALIGKCAKAITGNQEVQGASNVLTEQFSGDGTAQQQISLGNVPVASITSVIEATPTTLTRVYVTNPTTGQYYINLATGVITIGGTSVSGTLNYTVIYSINSGRIEPFVQYVDEVLTASSHVITLSQEPELIEYVEAVTGTVTGRINIITNGTVATKEGKLNRTAKTITFFATDAVLTARIRFKTTNRACGRAYESKSAGEIVRYDFSGIKS